MSKALDDSIVAVDNFADRLVAKLRYDTPRARVILESLDGGNDPFDDKDGVVSGVAGDMRAYRLDILDCLRCPDDLGHRRSRRFASQ